MDDQVFDSKYWDNEAERFSQYDMRDYSETFLKLAGVRPSEVVLDMGCGTGILTIALARAGISVIAVDFSSKMLEVTERELAAAGLTSHVRTILGSWEDDWEKLGINEVDVAFASRSIPRNDRTGAFTKLDRVARRKVCVTLSAGRTARSGEDGITAHENQASYPPSFAQGFDTLVNMGIYPEVSYIRSMKSGYEQPVYWAFISWNKEQGRKREDSII